MPPSTTLSPLRNTPPNVGTGELELDPRALRGIDQALRLALGALRVPLSLFILDGAERGVQLLRVAESGAWEPVHESGSAAALADQFVAAAAAVDPGSGTIVRGRIAVGQLGLVEYAALPVVVGGVRAGVFAVVDRRQREWGAQQEAILRDIVGVVAGEVEWHRGRIAGADAEATERLLSALVEATSDGIVMFDAGGRCRIWNPVVARRTGRAEAELVGADAEAVGAVLGIDALAARIEHALGDPESSADPSRGPHQPEPSPAGIAVLPVREESGRITGVLLLLRETDVRA
jgi:PAS domain S-box-containing protein